MNDLTSRTKKFALDVILYSRKLPRGEEFTIIKRQVNRSATSTAANYRSAQPPNPELTSSVNWAPPKKKPTNPCFGSNVWPIWLPTIIRNCNVC